MATEPMQLSRDKDLSMLAKLATAGRIDP